MDVNTRQSPQELGNATRQAQDANNRLRRPDGTVRSPSMDRNAFLRLLVTELRHQDPTQPMQDREFVAQMAQFSSLEQITNMNTTMQAMQASNRANEAYSLLGKRVDAVNPANGEMISGVVTRVALRENTYRLIVNNREIELSQIQAVYGAQERAPGRGAADGASATQQ